MTPAAISGTENRKRSWINWLFNDRPLPSYTLYPLLTQWPSIRLILVDWRAVDARGIEHPKLR